MRGSTASRKNPAPSPRAHLLSLPPEIQGIIIGNLAQSRDIKRLALSCKSLLAVALPQLYQTVELKVPLKWNRLASLEQLLVSASDGLRYTRRLSIVIQQIPIKDDRYGSRDLLDLTYNGGDVEDRSEDDDRTFKIYVPGRAASCALNALIRLLVLKIPRQQLREFLWIHECPLATSTLAILLNNHGGSLRTLQFRQHTSKWKKSNLGMLNLDLLTTLHLGALDVAYGTWPLQLLVSNSHHLHDIQLSNELEMVRQHARTGVVDPRGTARRRDTMSLITKLKDKLSDLEDPNGLVLRLKSLSLCGFDLHSLLKDNNGLVIDFKNLDRLTLESCSGLEAVFLMPLQPGVAQRGRLGAMCLNTFILREENITDAFMIELEKFLLSLNPLSILHVLLQGVSNLQILASILVTHGKSLRSLVWDMRTKPRDRMYVETSNSVSAHHDIQYVAKYCTRLEALGIQLAWNDLTTTSESRRSVSSHFSKLKYLRTLNVRNLPAVPLSEHWIPVKYAIEGLASLLVDVIYKKAGEGENSSIKTLGIGALTYGSFMMGPTYFRMHKSADFLQLRIFRVGFDSSRGSSRPHLLAKGTPADAYGYIEDLDIFKIYWLDAAIKKGDDYQDSD